MIQRLVLVILVLVPLARAADAQNSTAMLLRNPRETVVQMYDVLSDLTTGEAKGIYQSLSADLRSDLWTFQFEQFLATNPQLTPEQHAITMEAIGLVAMGILQQQALGGDGMEQANVRLGDIASRAAMVFSLSERRVFVDLGRRALGSTPVLSRDGEWSANTISSSPFQLNGLRPRYIAPNADCECYTEEDFCGNGPTAPSEICKRRASSCTRTTCCCGWFWAQGCNGLCEVA